LNPATPVEAFPSVEWDPPVLGGFVRVPRDGVFVVIFKIIADFGINNEISVGISIGGTPAIVALTQSGISTDSTSGYFTGTGIFRLHAGDRVGAINVGSDLDIVALTNQAELIASSYTLLIYRIGDL
jgi:hypothetical protein